MAKDQLNLLEAELRNADESRRLCRVNLAVHGLEGDIRHGGNVNSYDDPHDATGQFDFVLVTPTLNDSDWFRRDVEL